MHLVSGDAEMRRPRRSGRRATKGPSRSLKERSSVSFFCSFIIISPRSSLILVFASILYSPPHLPLLLCSLVLPHRAPPRKNDFPGNEGEKCSPLVPSTPTTNVHVKSDACEQPREREREREPICALLHLSIAAFISNGTGGGTGGSLTNWGMRSDALVSLFHRHKVHLQYMRMPTETHVGQTSVGHAHAQRHLRPKHHNLLKLLTVHMSASLRASLQLLVEYK